MKPIAVVALLVAALGLVACGGKSKQEKAQDQVCSARADMQKQVETLKGLTISTATSGKVKDSLTAIANDLKQISAAQGDLNAERKSQVQAANQAFRSQVQGIVADLGKGVSAGSAKTQLSAAVQQLATTYQQTFAKVNCGS